jgi:hypothetical protein
MPPARVYKLIDYVNDGIMTAAAPRDLAQAVVDRRNILVAGGTSQLVHKCLGFLRRAHHRRRQQDNELGPAGATFTAFPIAWMNSTISAQSPRLLA